MAEIQKIIIEDTFMKTLVSEYQNLPGEHCASAALRSLLRFYCKTDLPEDVIFGLGSGPDCIYLASEKMNPQIAMFGRTATLEVDLAGALGVDYQETIEPDNSKAWDDVRAEVLEGRPTMLSGDVFYLDYRKFKVHFPGHRFVLVGFDDEAEIAWVADRVDEKPQACSFSALAKSRNPSSGITYWNLWGKFHGTALAHALPDACAIALRRNADRMLGTDTFQSDFLKSGLSDETLVAVSGLAGLDRLSREIPAWQARDDAAFLASYVSQSIEKFGTGGGNFRKLYAGFLRWGHEVRPDLVPETLPELSARAADSWTELSATLRLASETPEESAHWSLAARQAKDIHALETELFEKMDAGLAKA